MKEIAEKIAITVYGTDSKGEMFVEDTTTAVLAHDWIKLVLRKRMTPGSEIIIFNKTNGNQAEFLLEDADATGLFRARLKDLTVDIWEMDFGLAPEPVVDTRARVHLVCKCCGSQESVLLDPEEESKAASGEILWRHCSKCVEETDWQSEAWLAEQRRREEKKRAEQRFAAPPSGPVAVAAPPAPAAPVAPPPALVATPPAPPPTPIVATTLPPEPVPAPVVAPPPPAPTPVVASSPLPPAPAPTPVIMPLQPEAPASEPVTAAPESSPEPTPPESTPDASPAAVAPPPINWAEKRTSRRIQMKTRARVRRPDGRSEVVSPLNVSRGGIAFESDVEYALDERIRVAMHYREGEDPLETNGVIVRVIPGGAEGRKDYGIKFE